MIVRAPCLAQTAFRGLLLAIVLFVPMATTAQVITTMAGGGAGDGGLAANAPLSPDIGLAYDAAGNLYISDTGQNRIRRVDAATGFITTVAGNGSFASNGDGGPALLASVGQPNGIALDSAGNLFISDGFGNVVRRVDAATGIITTVVGSGAVGFSGDGGPATGAAIFIPLGLAVDAFDNLFVVDNINRRVRKVTKATGIITTVVGNGTFDAFSANGIATASSLAYPVAVAWAPGNILYVADAGWGLIRRVDLDSGQMSVHAGQYVANTSGGYNGDGGATTHSLQEARGVVLNPAGEILIADSGNHRVRKVSSGQLTTLSGNGTAGFAGDGASASAAILNGPRGIAVDAAGNIAFVDYVNKRVRRIDASTGNIATIAGTGTLGSCCDGGQATGANLRNPSGVAMDGAGNVYIADTEGHRIRRVDAATKVITTIAGNGAPAFAGDNGPATAASLYSPTAAIFDSQGSLYIADTGNHRVRKVDAATGFITTVAGNGVGQFAGDSGPATSASLKAPTGLAFGESPDLLYIADTGNDRVRVVFLPGNNITTYAGDGSGGAIGGDPENGIIPYSGDGKQPQAAGLYRPTGIAFGPGSRLHIVDQGYGRVHKIDNGGFLTTITGDGSDASFGDGGQATAAGVYLPYGIHVDTDGNVFLSERHAIRRIDAGTGVIATIAGIGGAGFSGDGGLATAARLREPRGLARDGAGNLYIADGANDRIRMVSGAPVLPDTTITASPLATTTSTSASFSFTGSGGAGALTFECSLDGGAFASCTSPRTYSGLAIGAHTLAVRAVDTTITRDPTPAIANWQVVSLSDSTPDPFTFASQSSVPPSTQRTSAAITPSGYNATASISVANGEYSVGCGVSFTGAAGTITPGQSVCVRHVASPGAGLSVTTTLTIGGVAGTFTTTTAGATVLPLFNTGVDAAGAPLAGGSVDPHYTLVASADPAFPGPNAIVASAIAQGYWIPNGGNSKWIAPSANQNYPNTGPCNANGNYTYRTTLDLTGFDPATVAITGHWASDNTGAVLRVNGVATGFIASSYASYSDFALSSGFVAGVNTIDFVVNDFGCPTGIRVEFLSGTAMTVAAPDTTPDPFSFAAQTGVPPGTRVYSEIVIIAGYAAAAPISVTNGEYFINSLPFCSGPFTAVPGSITPGHRVCVSHMSAATPLTSTTTTLTIGGVGATFVSTTASAPAMPDPFSFASQTDVPISALRTSEAVTPTGYGIVATVTVANGGYSIGCDGNFTNQDGTISVGQSICVSHTSAATQLTSTTTTLTIGGRSVTFTSKTLALAPQWITFGVLLDRATGTAPFPVYAMASSGLPVVFTSLTPFLCTVNGSMVTLVTGGTCTIAADQPGNGIYNPAPRVTSHFEIAYGPNPWDVLAIATGGQHSCALTVNGGLQCWGGNGGGQLGDNSNAPSPVPVDVADLTSGVAAISAGAYHNCALTAEGGVKCWGFNSDGEVGDGSRTIRFAPVDVSGLASGVAAIATGASHSCALTTSGGVKCWGNNGAGQLGDNSQSTRLTPVDVAGLAGGVLAISAGVDHTCALVAGGGVKCWGANNNGQLGDNGQSNGLTPVDVLGLSSGAVAISSSSSFTCALTTSGGVKCWGVNYFGQLGDGTKDLRPAPVDVQGLASGVAAIAAGGRHACAVTSTGAVKCWGNNEFGQLGDSTSGADRTLPVDATGLADGIVATATGMNHTCALTVRGGVQCWGLNDYGQVGDGTSHADRHVPVQVLSLTGNDTPLMLSPTSLEFGNQPVGTTSAGQVITVTNYGGSPVTGLSWGATGEFAVSSTSCSTTLAPNASCTITVVFTPLSLGGRTGEQIVYNANGTPLTLQVSLFGTGTFSDTTPNAFSFVDQFLVPTGTVVTSAPVQITGLASSAPVTVIGGTYVVSSTNSCAGDVQGFTSNPGTIANGQFACVRHTTSAVPGGSNDTQLIVGGLGDTFTTVTIDPVPAPFVFAPLTGVAPATAQVSAPVVISGINVPSPVSVAGGAYSIGCTGAFTQAAGSIVNGQSICVQHTSAAGASASASTTLTVGGVAASFTTTTRPIGSQQLTADVQALDFGGQSMNTTALARSVTFTNSGVSPLTVSSVTASTYFAVTNNCSSLATGATCTANVTFTPTAQGALVGTLTITSSAGVQTVALAGTGEKSLVTHYYRAILNRAPDSAGKSYWESEAARLQGLLVDINETWFVMAGYFFNSAEYVAAGKTDTQFVTDLYNTFFNRAPDSGGLNYWVGQINGGLPREVVLFSFMFSPEFKSFTQGIFGNTASRAEVNVVIDFFRGILNKLPDTASFNYWLGRMRTAQCAGAGPVYTEVDNSSYFFMFSPEYAGRNRNNTQLVTDMYYSFLRRGGDTAGVQYWVNQLNTGQMNVNTVRSNFLNSPEFGTRVQAIIAQGCTP